MANYMLTIVSSSAFSMWWHATNHENQKTSTVKNTEMKYVPVEFRYIMDTLHHVTVSDVGNSGLANICGPRGQYSHLFHH